MVEIDLAILLCIVAWAGIATGVAVIMIIVAADRSTG